MSSENLGRPLFCATCRKQPQWVCVRATMPATVCCHDCGVYVQNSTMEGAKQAWNNIQHALMHMEAKPSAPGLSVMVSYRHDINDYVVRVGTKAQLDRPLPLEVDATCYRADGVKHSKRAIESVVTKMSSAPAFIAWMAQGGVTVERVQ